MRLKLAIVCTAAALIGCKVGPNYKRPVLTPPVQFRGSDPATDQASLGDTKWFDLFQDETLRGLIQEGLKSNYDIRISAQRVLAAQGQLAATRSGLFPQLNGQAGAARDGTKAPINSSAWGFGSASWEIDLFGKLRRATEAARADLLAIEENQKAVTQALIAEIASGYFDLLEYDAELAFVLDSIKTRRESLTLVESRERGGVASLLDVDQAKTLVHSAEANAALLEKAREQSENLISFLIGRQAGSIARGRTLVAQPQPPQVPAGLPSALLDRRPDVRAAEQQLIAANARIGVAKAAFFPSINITAAGGYQSTDLLGIISRGGFAYSMGGVVDLPIFDAGRRRGNYKTAQAEHEALLVNYQKTIDGAFRDVSDALIGYRRTKEYRGSQALLAATLREQTQLATQRYIGGVASYLEVLDSERQRLTSEQQLAQAQRDELVVLVQLYKALGGGWQ